MSERQTITADECADVLREIWREEEKTRKILETPDVIGRREYLAQRARAAQERIAPPERVPSLNRRLRDRLRQGRAFRALQRRMQGGQ